MGPVLDITIMVLLFAAVVAAALFGMQRLQTAVAVRRRLSGTTSGEVIRASSVVKKTAVQNPVLAWVQASSSISDAKDRSRLTKQLSQAGIEHPSAPALFVICRFGLAVGLPVAFILAQAVSPHPIVGLKQVFITLALCGVGLILPKAVLDNRVGARKAQLEREFPDALDLLVVCVEAGLALESAFVRVGAEVGESHPRISGVFGEVAQELRAGRSRADALRSMADRVEVDSLRAFCTLMIQTDALGTSIAQTLRTFSGEMRETRLMNAEEKAMRIPVLLTIPLVGCILPVIITALLLPGILDMIRTFGPAMKG